MKSITVLILVFLLGACSPPGEDRLDDLEREDELPIDELNDSYPF